MPAVAQQVSCSRTQQASLAACSLCYVVSIYLLVLIRVYSSVEPKFCDCYSLFVKCIDTLSNEFTRFEQPTAALV